MIATNPTPPPASELRRRSPTGRRSRPPFSSVLVRDHFDPCGCIRRVITYISSNTVHGHFIFKRATCLHLHLQREQKAEAVLGKLYGQSPERVSRIAAKLLLEKLEMETTN